MFPKPFDSVGPRRTEGLPLGAVRSEAESKAELSVRRSLGRLCQRRDDQRMARIDRHNVRSHPQARHGRADQSGQGDGVVVGLLEHPDLADTRGEGAASLTDDVIDGVNRRRAPMKNYSGGHVCDNPPGRSRYSLSLTVRKFGVTRDCASPGSAADPARRRARSAWPASTATMVQVIAMAACRSSSACDVAAAPLTGRGSLKSRETRDPSGRRCLGP